MVALYCRASRSVEPIGLPGASLTSYIVNSWRILEGYSGIFNVKGSRLMRDCGHDYSSLLWTGCSRLSHWL